jgi:2-polyprenyl-6-methoxyphenol hydroxylase-like FAD-dependent oxidoreductase
VLTISIKKIASSYRQGNVFLAGDAAHAFSPFGAPGLTTGFGDVTLLAELLGRVMIDGENAEILDTYETERTAVAREKQAASEHVLDIMIPRSTWSRWMRNLKLRLAVNIPSLRASLDAGPYDKRIETK